MSYAKSLFIFVLFTAINCGNSVIAFTTKSDFQLYAIPVVLMILLATVLLLAPPDVSWKLKIIAGISASIISFILGCLATGLVFVFYHPSQLVGKQPHDIVVDWCMFVITMVVPGLVSLLACGSYIVLYTALIVRRLRRAHDDGVRL